MLRVVGRDKDDVSAGVAAAPHADLCRIALWLAGYPAHDVQQVGGLVDRVDDFTDFLDFGREAAFGAARRLRLGQHHARVAAPQPR